MAGITRRDYRSILDHHLLRTFGDMQLTEVTDIRMEEFLAAEQAAGLFDRTRQKHRTVLHAIFERARRVKKLGVTENPLDAVDSIAVGERLPIEIYSTDEIAALVRAATTNADAALFATAAGAGLRRGELIALRVGDVDFAARKIRVEHSYGFGKETLPKSGRTRVVPIRADVAKLLAALLNERGNPGDDELVFPDADGGHRNGDAVSDCYVDARDRAGLRRLTFRALRSTWATQLAKRGIPAPTLQKWLGHSSITTTQRYIEHSAPGQRQRPVGPRVWV